MQPLCSVFDIPDGGSNGFFAETLDGRFLYIVVRKKHSVYVYKNACPHMGLPLDFKPGQFLTSDGNLIQCSTHGAKFLIKNGLCISGPCKGKKLESINTKIRRGKIYLTDFN